MSHAAYDIVILAKEKMVESLVEKSAGLFLCEELR